jgi:hypothetical protein
MDKNCRRGCSCRKMRVVLIVCLILIISGCAKVGVGGGSVGGNANISIDVSRGCVGLEVLGYSAPFSIQDINDIKALGYEECANYMASKINQE